MRREIFCRRKRWEVAWRHCHLSQARLVHIFIRAPFVRGFEQAFVIGEHEMNKTFFTTTTLALLSVTMLIGGCDCSKDVDDTASYATGEAQIKEGEKLKDQLKEIQQKKIDDANEVNK